MIEWGVESTKTVSWWQLAARATLKFGSLLSNCFDLGGLKPLYKESRIDVASAYKVEFNKLYKTFKNIEISNKNH